MFKKAKFSIVFKSLFGIIFLLVAFTMTVSFLGYRGFKESLLSQYADSAFRIAHTSATMLDADRVDAYAASGGQGEEYETVRHRISRICNAFGATFIYVIRPDLTDYNHITFIISTINDNVNYTEYEFGYYRETTNEDYRQKYRALYERTADEALVIRDAGYIETDPHITAMVPLIASDGTTQGILCVQMQMDYLTNARNMYVSNVFRTLISLTVITLVLLAYYLHETLLYPLQLITWEDGRFARENVTSSRKLTEMIRNKDEIGDLAVSIDRMEEQIQEYLEDLTVITAEKERINTELSLAKRIQQDMLPNTFPAFPDRNEFDIYASMDPARGVGGDFYDFFLVDDTHLCLVMADVSGKGVPAALFMMISKIILANTAQMWNSPAAILEHTNQAICSHNEEEMFVTVWLGILDLETGQLLAANAGHEYPVLKKADGEFALVMDKHGFVIGGMEGIKYKDYELRLEPGDKIFLYTDGLPEATDSREEMFGTSRMIEALNEQKDASPEEIIRHMRRTVDGFVKEAEQFDDLTMLCLEYYGV